jgi:hypothetical protein
MGTARLYVHSSTGVVGRQSQHNGWSKHIVPISNNSKEVPIVQKLKREMLDECEVGGLSGAFSYDTDINGKEMIIWCTGNNGGFQKAFSGVVNRVSRKTNLKFALRVQREITEAEWNYLVTNHG